MSETKTGLDLLRAPFPAHQISKLPKPSKQQTEAVKADFKKGIRCTICGTWHHPEVVHLDYVGHAALTDRLLDADPAWTWEPLSMSPDGLPMLDGYGGMWIRLTVCGVTRLGYGHPDGKEGGNAIKEVIGDALRNAAMRFGAALDLWHKGDLHADEDSDLAEKLKASIAIEKIKKGDGVIKGTDGIEKALDADRRAELDELALYLIELNTDGRGMEAVAAYYGIEDNDSKVYVWRCLQAESKLRAFLKANSPHKTVAA